MLKSIVVAAFWGAAGLFLASVPALAQLGGPANPPGAGYLGQQFVDRAGCLFLRAGNGAHILWVPMLDDAHRPICGMTPSGAAAASVARAPAVQAAPIAATIPVMPHPPKGWKLAWKDGRLNPMRGIGTAQGQAMQDQVWTRTVPARLISP